MSQECEPIVCKKAREARAGASLYNLFLPICLFMSARPCLRTVTPEPCLHKGEGVFHRQAPSAAAVMWFCFVLFIVGPGPVVIAVHEDQAWRWALRP
mmetsp:Transcript_63302/g.104572  ORF Transcript_63302/g.104572 Transcript_63302/m.104572 type:complete len:97 (+) Transcript_63302:134-424(+)|eukprot:CAMPEP_0174383342 /NCGR_PEP_ID=MMETSP0811_2-20130205/125155_1 /TAXON_ID=73025 ORGANISM="Eutreptiella gymnastica-like, Strain CCMP1594" /NCGR_SAMPLE_ID=MMETSP0811_2 /ASSEMBLY_ACC=CAM_ASM_000667 /LENGTH=96 /DNA_ID=CAMNT_0015536883 /DNA_START=1355 /DNA_END=1645 /DNA_ORIENTATION=-